jgi:hypothetical protein
LARRGKARFGRVRRTLPLLIATCIALALAGCGTYQPAPPVWAQLGRHPTLRVDGRDVPVLIMRGEETRAACERHLALDDPRRDRIIYGCTITTGWAGEIRARYVIVAADNEEQLHGVYATLHELKHILEPDWMHR